MSLADKWNPSHLLGFEIRFRFCVGPGIPLINPISSY